MYFLRGIIISIVTFPGVVIHELAHQLFCRLFGVAVYKVTYFQLANPIGFVHHEIPKKSIHSLFISIGPFFLNSILGMVIAFPAVIPVAHIGHLTFTDYFLLYLGISISMHAFPSIGDANNIWAIVRHGPNTPMWLKVLSFPIVCIIYVGALGSIVWLDLLYGAAVSIWLPMAILSAMV
ncbi:metalloprotease family protein [Chitinophaga sp. Cy-1792]|uniref:metalloprotease family protein n=1 Tax=Chitinophaga sp. Cy-1792 TaxID=2608339 RepID=UPI00141FAA06|nr:metalloprotease family protein [Chitinophaga sp. Cy-1792]NIG52565.1 DUF3267 domain-containing protein [Chitinophaga sp. Cy-1792]